jgi:hypothetical protein
LFRRRDEGSVQRFFGCVEITKQTDQRGQHVA